MKRISSKIIGIIILCTTLVAVTVGLLSIVQSSSILKAESHDKFKHMASQYANHISQTLYGIETSADTLMAYIGQTFDQKRFTEDAQYRSLYLESINAILMNTAQDIKGIHGIYLNVNPDLTGEVHGSWYISDGQGGFVQQELEDISLFNEGNPEMDWYYEPVHTRRGIWSPPYTDAVIGVRLLSYSKALYAGDELLGVVGMDIAFDDIQHTLEDMNVYDSGYASLFDDDLRILIHPTVPSGEKLASLDRGALAALAMQIDTTPTGVAEYTYLEENRVMGYSKLNNGWVLAIIAPIDEVFAPMHILQIDIILISLGILAASVLIGLLISRSITKPIRLLREMAVKISSGDHSARIEMDASSEINEMADSINAMAHSLIKTNKELQKASSEMKHMAFHDTLTGLPNRRYGKAKLQSIIDTGEYSDACTGVLFIDLDDFKTVNDTYGHDFGDDLLVQAARVMVHCVRKNDFIFRLGGDEFMIICESMPSEEHILHFADRLLATFGQPLLIRSERIRVTCSIGIAIAGQHGSDSAKALMKHADIALYRAKEAGKNKYHLFR